MPEAGKYGVLDPTLNPALLQGHSRDCVERAEMMHWLFEGVGCPACGSAHRVGVASKKYPSKRARYVFTCPACDHVTRLTVGQMGAPFQSGDSPKGYIVAQPAPRKAW